MVTHEYTVRFKRYERTDSRLGRHVRHDSRSLQYLYPEADPKTLVSKRHYSNIPVLDQGQIGSCTGNAATKCISYDYFWGAPVQAMLSQTDGAADETYAVGVYSAATALDPYDGTYPPTDTGSDGVSVAKVLQQRGLISGYQHATSLDAVLNALQNQPVIVGTEWREDMFNPQSDGRLAITGSTAGGHEYVLDEIDVENKRVWMQNSWGTSWGMSGRAYYTFDDVEALLSADGDCTIFVPVTAPAPQPTPVPTNPDQTLLSSVAKWMSHKRFFPCNERVRQALLKWKFDKNL